MLPPQAAGANVSCFRRRPPAVTLIFLHSPWVRSHTASSGKEGARHGVARCLARGSLRSRQANGPAWRHPGAGPRRADAEGAGRRRRPRHRRLRLGLSRLAARRRRSGDDGRGEAALGRRHQVRARPERGSRRHCALGRPAGGAARRGPRRGRLRPLVRQGARRRSVRRRLPPRQHGRKRGEGRRARLHGRRPHRRELDRAAPFRVRAGRRDDADPLARRRAGDPRLRHPRLGAVALFRLLGRAEMREGHDRGHRRRRRRPAPARRSRSRPTSRCPRAGSTSGCTTRRSRRKPGSTTTSASQPRPSPAPTGSTSACTATVRHGSASSRPESPGSTRRTRWSCWASTTPNAAGSGSRPGRSAWSGRSTWRASANGRRIWSTSSSSRKSAS